MTRFRQVVGAALLALSIVAPAAAKEPLRIGFSDWPGWTPLQIAVDKGWFKEAGVDVTMQWFDYSASLDAFSAGKLDGDFVATGDALSTGAAGGKNVLILLTDYSSGNDQVVGAPGLRNVKQLKGKKVGDVTLVNAKTNETPQVLASGSVAAICAWQPISGQAARQTPGARPIFTSAQAPGLIYDGLAVSPQSLKDRRDDWAKVLGVWYRVVAYINDPKTRPEALKIMAARDGVDVPTYTPYVKGTHILSLAEAKKAFRKGSGLDSIYGSDANADEFNVRNGVYKEKQDIASYIDPSLTAAR